MTEFLCFIIAVMALAIMFLFGFLVENWRFLIWKNKGRIFRIYKEKNYYYAEKKFLWFFIRSDRDKDYSSREEAIAYIQNFLKDIEQEKNAKKEIFDFSNQISDPTKLIESKQLETKRIEYDKD